MSGSDLDQRQECAPIALDDQPKIVEVDGDTKKADPDTQKEDAAFRPTAGQQIEPVHEPKCDQGTAEPNQEHRASKDDVVARRRDDAGPTEKMVRYTGYSSFATLVIAVISTLQLSAFWLTISDTRRSAIAAEKSAVAAENAVGITRDTAVRQLRAYIAIPLATLRISGNKAYVTLDAKNFGQTPAYDIRARLQSGVRSSSGQTRANPREDGTMPAIFLAPGDHRALKLTEGLQDTDLADLESGRSVLFVIGRIDYKDAFGNARYTEFRMRSSNAPDGGWSFMAEPEGNSSN